MDMSVVSLPPILTLCVQTRPEPRSDPCRRSVGRLAGRRDEARRFVKAGCDLLLAEAGDCQRAPVSTQLAVMTESPGSISWVCRPTVVAPILGRGSRRSTNRGGDRCGARCVARRIDPGPGSATGAARPWWPRATRAGRATRPGSRFCDACGQPLTGVAESTSAPAADAPTSTPGRLTRTTPSGREGLEGERKQVTVLFADIVGSTALIEGRDPEEAQRLLDGAVKVMMDAVHRYEGTVSRLMGDGLMALFGRRSPTRTTPSAPATPRWRCRRAWRGTPSRPASGTASRSACGSG